jgi:hypothetical protein
MPRDRRGSGQWLCQGLPSFFDVALYGLKDFFVAQHLSPQRSLRGWHATLG